MEVIQKQGKIKYHSQNHSSVAAEKSTRGGRNILLQADIIVLHRMWINRSFQSPGSSCNRILSNSVVRQLRSTDSVGNIRQLCQIMSTLIIPDINICKNNLSVVLGSRNNRANHVKSLL